MFQSFKAPKSLTRQEERELLRAVRSQGCPRDRAILTVALGTGLRLRELAGLNVGDVCPKEAEIAWKFALDPRLTKCGKGCIAYLTPPVRAELGRFVRWKHRVGEPLEARAPLFLSSLGRRISLRRVQIMFREWQRAAGFEADAAQMRQITPLIRERIKLLRDVLTAADFFFVRELPAYDPALLIPQKGDAALAKKVLEKAREVLAKTDFTHDALDQALRAAAQELGVKAGQMFTPIRVAVTGRTAAPPLFETLAVLGRDTTLPRIDLAIRKVG